jgi:CheY-like chemotaxis protein
VRVPRKLQNTATAAGALDRDALAFLATVSHELRTPMTGILGAAELLAEAPLPPEQAWLAQSIVASGQAMLRLLTDLLDLSRIESGRWELEHVSFVLRPLLDEIAAAWRPAATAKGIELRLEVEPSVPEALVGDAGRLRQVLGNLLSNAIKFTAAGHVALSVRPEPAGLRFTVADTGAGIPADRLGTLFEPYRQASAATRRLHGGTGLGLAICRGLVGLMGGEIGIDSTPGEGTRVRFALPVCPAPTEAEAAPAPPEVPSMKLLLVEDHPVNQAVIGSMLGRLGHIVDIVGNGHAAIEAVREDDYEAVLMDVQMPDIDGIEATRAIRALGGAAGKTRIIALTAQALPEDRARFLAAGMDDYLAKPIDRNQLAAALLRARAGAPAPAPNVATTTPAPTKPALSADARGLLEQLTKAAEDLA